MKKTTRKRLPLPRVQTVHTPSGATPKSIIELTPTPSGASASASASQRKRSSSRRRIPLRRQPAQGYRSKSASGSPIFHSHAAHDYEIIMYDNIVKDVKKQAAHPSPVELLKALGKPQKYMHVFIARRKTKERIHLFQVSPGNYVVSYYKNDNVSDHIDKVNPVIVAREFISGAPWIQHII